MMKLSQQDRAKEVWKFYLISFLLPAIAQLIAYALGGYFPFGDKTVLAWDLDNQS